MQRRLTADKRNRALAVLSPSRHRVYTFDTDEQQSSVKYSHFRLVIRTPSTAPFTLGNNFYSNKSHGDSVVLLWQISIPLIYKLLCNNTLPIRIHWNAFHYPNQPPESQLYCIAFPFYCIWTSNTKADFKPITTSCKLAFILLWLLKCVLIN